MTNELIERIGRAIEAAPNDRDAMARAVIATIGAGLTREHVRTAQRAADEHFVSYADLNEGRRLNEIAAVIAVIVEAKA